MPTYQYCCRDCGDEIEKLQSHAQMTKDATRLRCAKCEGRMQHVFGVPGIVTDTTFVRGKGDGLGDDEFKRRFAYAAARQAGVNPNGKTFYPGLCEQGKPYDPKAWIPEDGARGGIRKRCEELNYACEGDITVKQREPETDPHEGPYRVDDRLVQKEVDQIVETEREGHITPDKRADLVEATAERMAGNQ